MHPRNLRNSSRLFMAALLLLTSCASAPANDPGRATPPPVGSAVSETSGQPPAGATASGSASNASASNAPASTFSSPTCPNGAPIERGGKRKLALVVGVGDYANPRINDLTGPPNDARHVYALLTDPTGYAFPKENVCLVTNQEARTAAFVSLFESRLIARAQPGDQAFFFFAGHGSQVHDKDGDEPDEFDETLLFQDARMDPVRDFTDDQLNGLLARLYARTHEVTVMVDACNSGSITRDDSVARWAPPEAARAEDTAASTGGAGDGGERWAPASMPDAVFLSAAGDGTSALERDGQGLFSQAILSILSENRGNPLSWQDVALQVPPRLKAARSDQIPYFSGALARPVLGGGPGNAQTSNTVGVMEGTTLGWVIQSVTGDEVVLTGPPWLSGWSKGAEVRVYEANAQGPALHDPSRSLAKLEVIAAEGPSVRARRVSRPQPGKPALAPGQVAMLVRPGDDALRFTFSIRPASQPGGVSAMRAAAIRAALAKDDKTRLVVLEQPQRGSLELLASASGQLQLINGSGKIQNSFTPDQNKEPEQVVRSLWQHARQLALFNLQGEGGTMFSNNRTLQAQLVPAPKQAPCAKGVWVQAEPNHEQTIPLCHAYQIKVTLSPAAPRALLVGSLLLYGDGGIEALPSDRTLVRLEPGASVTFRDTFRAEPPLDTLEHLMIYGTQEENPVIWGRFADPSVTQSQGVATRSTTRAGTGSGELQTTLERFLLPGQRGGVRMDDAAETSTSLWTSSEVPMRVEANTRFTSGESAPAQATLMREYTVPNFDVRPYLPDDKASGLYRVLEQAQALAARSGQDGVPYKQHDWSGASDDANLAVGIDCSRAIWFAFTRAGLPYTPGNRYVSTREMVDARSPLSGSFEACPVEGALALGDVLVYRDEGRNAGHVVMVIDPEKRIAWGSHGWDGNSREGLAADRGVEYQRIKYKKDWERWDRKTMKRVACWRHRQLQTEALSPAGQPGMAALNASCEPARCK